MSNPNHAPEAPRDQTDPTTSLGGPRRSLLNIWTVIGGFGGVLAIIGTVISILAFQQQQADSASSDDSQATVVAILQAQLDVQRELATVQANPADSGPTATALAERREELIATQQALDEGLRQAAATQTAIARNPRPAAGGAGEQAAASANTAPLMVECPEALAFGQTASCAIGAAAEVDSYAFEAAQNDQVLIRLFKVSGNLFPRLRVLDPNGNAVCDGTRNPLVSIPSCAINTAGRHTIQVDDYSTEGTGEYRLFIQRLNGVALAQELSFGAAAQGEVAMIAGLPSYTFAAQMNDVITVRFTRLGGAFFPAVYIWDAAGQSVCGKADQPVVAFNCPINADGIYSITVDDYYQKSTGTFTLLAQRLNAPGSATELGFGRQAEGAVTVVGQLSSFAITARANDTATITVSKTGGGIYPRVGVYDAAGAQICQGSTSPNTIIRDCAFPADGQYFIYVDDYYMKQTGTFTIVAEKV